MKFEQVPLSEAAGAILAHSIPTPSGAIKKGRVLNANDIERLAAVGIAHVTAALLEPGDIGEDAAAARVAAALCGSAMHVAEPFTGRANLYADAGGLVEIDAVRLSRINAIDESLTVATVPAKNEPIAAMPSAMPARPCFAIWWPSSVVTTALASPGMLTRMAVVEPPYCAP